MKKKSAKSRSKAKAVAKVAPAPTRISNFTLGIAMIFSMVIQSVVPALTAWAAPTPDVTLTSKPFILDENLDENEATVDGFGQQVGVGTFNPPVNGIPPIKDYPEGACIPVLVTASNAEDNAEIISFTVVYDYKQSSTTSIGIEDIEMITPQVSGDSGANATNLSDFVYNTNASLSAATTFVSSAGTVFADITGPFAGNSGSAPVTANGTERHYNVSLYAQDPDITNPDVGIEPGVDVFVLMCARLGVDASDLPGASMKINMGSGNGQTNTQIDPKLILELPSLTLTKIVSSGSASPAAFSFIVAPAINNISEFTTTLDPVEEGDPITASVTIPNISPNGEYTIVEADNGPEGYHLESISGCDFEGETASVNLAAGDPAISASCTFTNAADPVATTGTLIIQKVVVNDNGGDAVATDFSFQVNDGNAVVFEDADQDPLTGENRLIVEAEAGPYTITEVAAPGYATTLSNCDAVEVPAGGTATCVITNDDNAPTLKLMKIVEAIDENALDPSEWDLSASGVDGFSDQGYSTTFHTVRANEAYTLTEELVPGYTPENWSCNGGVLVGDTVTLALDEDVTCTITNVQDETPEPTGTLIVQKNVVNDNEGLSNADDFSFQINNGPAIAFIDSDDNNLLTGENEIELEVGTYSVTEVAAAGYIPIFQGCTNIEVVANQTVTCTITNNDVVPDPVPTEGTLIVVKQMAGNGPNEAGDFTLVISNDSGEVYSFPGDDGTEKPLDEGEYVVSEIIPDDIGGYTPSFPQGEGIENDCDANGNVTIVADEGATCILVNTFAVIEEGMGTITVINDIRNDNGGDAILTDFTLRLDSVAVTSGEPNTRAPGPYVVTQETDETGYVTFFPQDIPNACDEDGNVTVGEGDPVTCIIVNDDIGPTMFSFSLTTNGDGHGRVEGGRAESESEDIFCDTDTEEDICSHEYEEGTVVTITAFPDEGSNFDSSWSGACSGNNPVCQVTMSGNMNVNAHFALNSTGSGGGGGGGGCGTCGVLPPGSTIQQPTVPPAGQVLGETDEVIVPAPVTPDPQVLGAVDALPVTGVPAGAAVLLLLPFVWALRKRENA